MATFREQITMLRRESGLTQKEFADLIGIKRGTLAMYEVGNRVPDIDVLKQISEKLHCSMDFLTGNEIPRNITSAQSYFAPILGVVPAGNPLTATEDILGYYPIAPNVRNPQECFWLKVKGDSMIDAGIEPNDIVLIRKQEYAEIGQIVVCRINGDEATLKRYTRQGDNVLLMPANSRYQPIIVPIDQFDDGYASIIGIAIGLTRGF